MFRGRLLEALLAGVTVWGCSNPYSGPVADGDVAAASDASAAPGAGGRAGGAGGVRAGGGTGGRAAAPGGGAGGRGGAGGAGAPKDAGSVAPDAADPCPNGPCFKATAVSVGHAHACALLVDGTVRCWGSNGQGQLGNPEVSEDHVNFPVKVVAVANAVAIAAGWNHTCALSADGTVFCWGRNEHGQLGGGMIEPPLPELTDGGLPSAVRGKTVLTAAGARGATAIGAGAEHTCALMPGGSIRCWGYNYYPLGVGSTDSNVPSPSEVTGLSGVSVIAVGSYHTCARLSDSSVSCWGGNSNDETGTPQVGFSGVAAPTSVRNVSGVVALAAGLKHTCALINDGSVRCWGGGEDGQLGNGALPARSAPVAVKNLGKVLGLVAGPSRTCAIGADASTRCWGDNRFGEFGIGLGSVTPLPVLSGFAGETTLSSGDYTSCVVVNGGSIRCSGYRLYGPVRGDLVAPTPVTVPGF